MKRYLLLFVFCFIATVALGQVLEGLPTRLTPATVGIQQGNVSTDIILLNPSTKMRLIAITMKESASPAGSAKVVIRHGTLSDGNCIGNVISYAELPANTDKQLSYFARGVYVPNGICVDMKSGVIDINIMTMTE